MAKISVRGAKIAAARLDAARDTILEYLSDAVMDEAEQVRADEQARVPVKSGDLRRGIEAWRTGSLSAQVVIGGPEVKYGVWIEWGRKRAPAQPFVTPAAELARSRWPRRATETVERAVSDAQR